MTQIKSEMLQEFKVKQHGCVSPEGILISCKPYEHMLVMGVKEYYDEVYEEFWHEAHMTVHYESEAAGDDFYHPEWHRFEMSDDTQERAYKHAYDLGWVRLIVDESRRMIYAESTKETIRVRKKDLQFVADCLDLKLDIRLII